MNHFRLIGLSAAILVSSSAAAQAADPVAGKAFFDQRCTMCHSTTPGARSPMAPNLATVSGRVAGMSEFTNYSPALKKSGLTWTAANLDKFLTAPNKMVPGTRMVISVPDLKRADLVAYLVTLKKK